MTWWTFMTYGVAAVVLLIIVCKVLGYMFPIQEDEDEDW